MSDNGLVKAIDAAIQEDEERRKKRYHLGASQIGAQCARALWYSFRWAHRVRFSGRMIRLFRRGHKQEDDVIAWLRLIGVTVQDYSERLLYHDSSDSYLTSPWDVDWSTGEPLDDVSEDPVHIQRATKRGQGPKQWKFEDGQISGSSDGKIVDGLPMCANGPGKLEVKTYNSKRFKVLESKGVVQAAPEHFVQMQIYMHYFDCEWCLYVAVCKDDDNLHIEYVRYKPEVAEHYIKRAKAIVLQTYEPPRINESPGWYRCKFCDFKRICHEGHSAQKNCRSCVHGVPDPDSDVWRCKNNYMQPIPREFQNVGCDQWDDITGNNG